jgi:hypothetical protein
MSFIAYIENENGDRVDGTMFNLSEYGVMQSINKYGFDPKTLSNKSCKRAAIIIKKFMLNNILLLTELSINEWINDPGFPNDMKNWVSYNTFVGIYKRLLNMLTMYPNCTFV